MAVAEAELTGESLPVPKDSRAIGGNGHLPLGDQGNMVFMSTAVVAGRGRAVAVATGMATEVGNIASDVAQASTETPVQRKLADFGRRLGFAILVIVGTVLGLGAALGHPLSEMFYVGINLVATGVFDKPLALEQGDPDLMNRPPRPPGDPLLTRAAFMRVMLMGLGMAAGTLAVFAWELSLGTPLEHARTEAFTVNATFQAFSAFAFRSAHRPFYHLPPNWWLFGGALLAFFIQMLAVYWKPLQLLLGTVPIAPWEFGLAMLEGMSLLVAAEAYKGLRWRIRHVERPVAW